MAGLGDRLRAIGTLFGEALHARFELLAAEVEQLIGTVLRAFLAGLAAVAFAVIAVLTAVVAALVAVPESERAAVAALAALLLGLIAAGLFLWSARLARFGVFAVSLEEFRVDLDRLHPDGSRSSGPRPTAPSQSREHDRA